MKLVQIALELNLNTELCTKCGGSCCSKQPGISHPDQWGKTPEKILESLVAAFSAKPTQWAVDWWQGDTEPSYELDDVYFVRPAAKTNSTLFHGAGTHAPCVFLGGHGCTLQPHARPSQCLDLVPGMKGDRYHCAWIEGGSKEDYARAWRPYQSVILEAAKQVGFDPKDRDEDYVPPFAGLFGY